MIDRNNFKLSIIIPCFNEKRTIGIILERINKSLKNYQISNYEIIIVDDSSSDGTRNILKDFENKEKCLKNNVSNYIKDVVLGKNDEIRFFKDQINNRK